MTCVFLAFLRIAYWEKTFWSGFRIVYLYCVLRMDKADFGARSVLRIAYCVLRGALWNAKRIAYCVLRIGGRTLEREAYCVLRIAYWGAHFGARSVLRIAYCVLRIVYCIWRPPS